MFHQSGLKSLSFSIGNCHHFQIEMNCDHFPFHYMNQTGFRVAHSQQEKHQYDHSPIKLEVTKVNDRRMKTGFLWNLKSNLIVHTAVILFFCFTQFTLFVYKSLIIVAEKFQKYHWIQYKKNFTLYQIVGNLLNLSYFWADLYIKWMLRYNWNVLAKNPETDYICSCSDFCLENINNLCCNFCIYAST